MAKTGLKSKKTIVRDKIGADGKIHAIAYARVWDDDLEQDPEAQFKILREWAEENNAILEAEIADRSDGQDWNAPGIKRIKELMEKNESISTIVVIDIGRLCRTVHYHHQFIFELCEDRYHIVTPTSSYDDCAKIECICIDVVKIASYECEYELYKNLGIKTILGQCTFRDFVNVSKNYWESKRCQKKD